MSRGNKNPFNVMNSTIWRGSYLERMENTGTGPESTLEVESDASQDASRAWSEHPVAGAARSHQSPASWLHGNAAKWVRQGERDSGQVGLQTDARQPIKALETRQSRAAAPNDIMRKASGVFRRRTVDADRSEGRFMTIEGPRRGSSDCAWCR